VVGFIYNLRKLKTIIGDKDCPQVGNVIIFAENTNNDKIVSDGDTVVNIFTTSEYKKSGVLNNLNSKRKRCLRLFFIHCWQQLILIKWQTGINTKTKLTLSRKREKWITNLTCFTNSYLNCMTLTIAHIK